jgi:hypothetical protein
MIGRGGFEGGIEVGICPRVLNCVISERLMKTFSIENTFTPCQGVYKLLNLQTPQLRRRYPEEAS